MKAERRHELQTNSLALWLRWRAPQLWQEHGTKVLLGLVIVAAIVVFARWKINEPKAKAAEAEKSLGMARQWVGQLAGMQLTPGEAEKIPDLIRSAMEVSEQREIRARAQAILGDYYWALANYPELPEAATRPSLRPELPQEELLAKADEAYRQALKEQPEQGDLIARAHMGLAAIAETRAFDAQRKAGAKVQSGKNPQWLAASAEYEAVIGSTAVPQILKDEAKWHKESLPGLEKPIWLERPTTMPTTTQPATTAAGPVDAGGSAGSAKTAASKPATNPAG